MDYGFKLKDLEGNKLPYEVVKKEVTLSDGSIQVCSVKIYPKLGPTNVSQRTVPRNYNVHEEVFLSVVYDLG